MNLEELQSLYDFTDRTVLVTGGAGVLGSEIACALLGCNANVVILDRDLELAQKAIERFPHEVKGRAVRVYGDVLNVETLQQADETIKADLSFFDLRLNALRHVGDLNLLGTILPCQVFGRDMAGRGEGVILNISSMNALRPLTRIPAYSAAKAAVTNFTQWLAVHMAQNYSPHIRVNAIAPGFFVGEQNRRLLLNEDGSLTPRGQTILSHTPMNRFGTPEDLFGVTMWLISPAASFVTGTVIPIDGGFSAFSGV